MNESAKTFRDVFRSEFESRTKRNPYYSLRSFARDMDLVPSRVSDLLRGKQGLSRRSAERLATKMGLSQSEKTWFIADAERRHSRSEIQRSLATKKLQELESPVSYRSVSEAYFNIVSDWYHFAIVEMIPVAGFQSSPSWIAKRLGISTIQVEQALRRLEQVGLIKKIGKKWVTPEVPPATANDTPSQAIKNHHQQILEKALTALILESVDSREFSSNTLAVDPQDLPQIKNEIRQFRRQLEAKYKRTTKGAQVYSLAIQFFSLTKEKP